ncbi:hypothetical protein F4824DRAFT_492734 [Ustulina deusta]|nr:hypothetical protein F4824DRAFT_492734 [Ustulina deusta]
MRNTAKKTLEVLESFFGGLMLLPEPGTTPDTISSVFSSLRACVLDSNECYSCARLDQNLKAKLPVDSPALGPSSRLERVCAFDLYYY